MQEPSTKGYYLVFYHDIHAVLDRFIQTNEKVKYMQYADFDEIKEIGSGGYAYCQIQKACMGYVRNCCFKCCDRMLKLFISKVSNLW